MKPTMSLSIEQAFNHRHWLFYCLKNINHPSSNNSFDTSERIIYVYEFPINATREIGLISIYVTLLNNGIGE